MLFGTPQTQPHQGLALSNDVVFKTLFCQAPHLLSDLVNAVRHGMRPIRLVRVLNPHLLPADLIGKHVVLDILAQDTEGRRFAIEMQWRRYLHWPERNVFYLARTLADQLRPGEDYRMLKPAIGVSFLRHDLFRQRSAQADWHFELRDKRNPETTLGEGLQIHIIELGKASRLHGYPPALSAWIACLLHNLDEDRMNQIQHPPVLEALERLKTLYSDEELRLAAEQRQRALIDEQDALDLARLEGRQEGIDHGQAALLQSLLAHRFGPLPAGVRDKLNGAHSSQLQAWARNLLAARTLDDVFY